MTGARARRCVGILGRAVGDLRQSSSQWLRRPLDDPAVMLGVCKESFDHMLISGARSRSFGSLVGGRSGAGKEGVLQVKEARNSVELWWIRSKGFPQGSGILNRSLCTSGSSEGVGAGKTRQAISKIAGETAKKAVRGGPVSWVSLGLLMVTGVGLILLWDLEKKRQLEELHSEKPVVAKQGPGVGKAAIGGPFKLVNQDGKVVTDRDFVGNWTLVYFGFTYCPDICPDELTKLAAAVDNIEKKAGLQVLPVFISIDPERDTVEQIREYLKEYHPRFVGLTGTVEDIRQAAREYRVYYMKTEDEGTDYLVDHSIITYLMDPDMNFVKFFGKNYDADSLADGVLAEIKQSNKGK